MPAILIPADARGTFIHRTNGVRVELHAAVTGAASSPLALKRRTCSPPPSPEADPQRGAGAVRAD